MPDYSIPDSHSNSSLIHLLNMHPLTSSSMPDIVLVCEDTEMNENSYSASVKLLNSQ